MASGVSGWDLELPWQLTKGPLSIGVQSKNDQPKRGSPKKDAYDVP